MKKLLIIAAFLSLSTSSFASKIIKETIYKGKLDQENLNSLLLVSKFYDVKIIKTTTNSFQYDLKTNLKNEDFNSEYYKASSFSLLPSINSKTSLPLKISFIKKGDFQIVGEKISVEGDLNIEESKIGNIKYEFNMYDLPIRRINNPKVSRTLENTKEGFIIVENREIQ